MEFDGCFVDMRNVEPSISTLDFLIEAKKEKFLSSLQWYSGDG